MNIMYITDCIFSNAELSTKFFLFNQNISVFVVKKSNFFNKSIDKNFIYIEYEDDRELLEIVLYAYTKYKIDAISIENMNQCMHFIQKIKKQLPFSHIFLNIETPLNRQIEDILQYEKNHTLLSGIATYDTSFVKDIIENIRVPLYEYGEETDNNFTKYQNITINVLLFGTFETIEDLFEFIEIIDKVPQDIKNCFLFDLYLYNDNSHIKKELESIAWINYKGKIEKLHFQYAKDHYNVSLIYIHQRYAKRKKVLYATTELENIFSNTIVVSNENVQLSCQGAMQFNSELDDSLYVAMDKAYGIVRIKDSIKQKQSFIKSKIINFYQQVINKERYFNNAVGKQKRLNLLYISPRVFGLSATQGTYLIAEGYFKYTDFTIISAEKKDHDIVTYTTTDIPLNVIKFGSKDYIDKVITYVISKEPNLVCLGNWGQWSNVVLALKEYCPDIKISLEIKSPLICREEEKSYLREKFSSAIEYVDMFISPNKYMLESWFPNKSLQDLNKKPILYHRQVINCNFYEKPTSKKIEIEDRNIKFIFVGSLTQNRQINILLEYISGLPKDILERSIFDFYGDGNAKAELEEYAKLLNIQNCVSFKGSFPQKDLYRIYREYDVGLAWVPISDFDAAPSLKLLEYFGAGLLPLATKNKGHSFMEKYGYKIHYFDYNLESFHKMVKNAIETIRNNNFKDIIENNLFLSRKHHYLEVVKEEILPFYIKNVAPSVYKNWKQALNKSTDVIFNKKELKFDIDKEITMHKQRFGDML